MLVLDASTTLAIVLDEMGGVEAKAILDRIKADGALVPPLWAQEVGNALLVAERRRRITAADTVEAMELLDQLPIEVTEVDPWLAELASCARQYDLTTYAATYLLTAMQSGYPLATQDASLARAAHRAGVELI